MTSSFPFLFFFFFFFFAMKMVDFVSFYRRFNNIAGKQSFSTLYTAINGNNQTPHANLLLLLKRTGPIPFCVSHLRLALLCAYADSQRALAFASFVALTVLAGHYTSYGTKFPVPEKRRKRLYQEYAEIEKNIRKQR
jgi:hypothetical protein